MSKKYRDRHVEFVRLAEKVVGVGGTISRKQALDVVKANGLEKPRWLFNDKAYRVGRALYALPVLNEDGAEEVAEETEAQVTETTEETNVAAHEIPNDSSELATEKTA